MNKSVISLLCRFSTCRYPHLLLSTGACSTLSAARRSYRLKSPARKALSSKPAGAGAAVDRWNRQTDGRTVTLSPSLYLPLCLSVAVMLITSVLSIVVHGLHPTAT